MSRRFLLTFFIAVTCVATLIAVRVANSAAHWTPTRNAPVAQDHAPLTPAQGPADLVLTNALIETMDPAHEWAGAVAIRGESIVAVSYIAPDSSDAQKADSADAPEIKPWLGPNTRILNMHGAFVMAGFNDAHVHIGQSALTKLAIDFTGVESLAEFQKRIRENIKARAPGEWITGFGWDQTLWPGRRDPTRADLDAVSTAYPMFFARVDGHVAIANSLALKIAGVTQNTPQPATGHIVRDAQTDEPTGLLQEDGATNLVFSKSGAPSAAERRRGIELVLADAARDGVTSLQDCSYLEISRDVSFSKENFLIYQQLRKEGKLTARITEWLDFTMPLSKLEAMRSEWGSTDPWLKTGALKAFLDGSLGSRTAALFAPYSDAPGTSGLLHLDEAQLAPLAIERDRAGFQLAFHAIGDRANHVALDTFAAVVAANGPRDRRDRVEHAQVVAPEEFARFGKLDIVASMQPSHLLDDGRWASDRLGPERSRGAYAWRSMQQNGVHLAFGTDHPVEPLNPLRGIYACVTRELPQGSASWQPQEALSMKDCLRAYTAGAAYAEFEEKRKGTIAPGMLADLVVYAANLNQIPARELLTTKVKMTIAGGRIVYQQPENKLAQRTLTHFSTSTP
jgi:predicted amidohydrolase YtcJ